MIVLIDQDEPLAKFEECFLEEWRKKYPKEMFVPLEERRALRIKDDYPDFLKTKVEKIYSTPGFVFNLKPVLQGIRAIVGLMELGHDVRICTAPLKQFENCVLEKFLWIEKYLGRDFTDRIIFSKDKRLIKGDFLIDDRPIDGDSDWEQIIFDAPYNRYLKGKKRMNADWSNWRELLLAN